VDFSGCFIARWSARRSISLPYFRRGDLGFRGCCDCFRDHHTPDNASHKQNRLTISPRAFPSILDGSSHPLTEVAPPFSPTAAHSSPESLVASSRPTPVYGRALPNSECLMYSLKSTIDSHSNVLAVCRATWLPPGHRQRNCPRPRPWRSSCQSRLPRSLPLQTPHRNLHRQRGHVHWPIHLCRQKGKFDSRQCSPPRRHA